jgi:hypothetical protein
VRTFAILSLVALAIAGCGGGAPRDSATEFKGEKRKVAAPVEALEKAARAGESGTVCTKLLTDRLLAQLKDQGTICTTAVKEAFKDADSFDLTVDEVTISGDKATAKVISGTGSGKKTDTLDLARDGAAWKIDELRS